MNDGEFYLNELERPCAVARITGATEPVPGRQGLSQYGQRQICSGAVLTVPDRFGANPNAQCHLGKFRPIVPLPEDDEEGQSLKI